MGVIGGLWWVMDAISHIGVQRWVICYAKCAELCDLFFFSGTTAGGVDIVNFTSVGVTTFAVVRGLSLQSGVTYYATVKATDFTGMSSYAVSQGVSVDTTEPVVGGVELQGTTQFQNGLELIWDQILDEESDIVGVEWSLGTRPGSGDITGWRQASLEDTTRLRVNSTGLGLYQGQVIFATLKVL